MTCGSLTCTVYNVVQCFSMHMLEFSSRINVHSVFFSFQTEFLNSVMLNSWMSWHLYIESFNNIRHNLLVYIQRYVLHFVIRSIFRYFSFFQTKFCQFNFNRLCFRYMAVGQLLVENREISKSIPENTECRLCLYCYNSSH